jgi:hypothetical protein
MLRLRECKSPRIGPNASECGAMRINTGIPGGFRLRFLASGAGVGRLLEAIEKQAIISIDISVFLGVL